MLVLDYKKNSKFEIEFTNLDEVKEGDKVVFFLKDGDLSPLINLMEDTLYDFSNVELCIPYITNIARDYIAVELYNTQGILVNYFDNKEDNKTLYINILPKWNILEDNAVLFLNDDDCDKYNKNFTYSGLRPRKCSGLRPRKCNSDIYITDYYNKISIIIPELHTEDKSCQYHIENINKVCKELKEKHSIERIELFISHCFLDINYKMLEDNELWSYNENRLDSTLLIKDFFIDKITTTNSTGILEVQKSERLEVIDCCKFFNI